MDFNQLHTIYFLGIGGIGMSGLARYFKLNGAEIHGYDRTSTELTQELEAEGMHIHYHDDVSLIPGQVDLVIYTPAIPKDQGEFVFLKDKMEPQGRFLKRAQVLGLISKERRCVAIAGTHGKTTTSTIAAHLLREGGVDCSAFLGGIARNFNGNFVHGESDVVVVEADEYDRSFLQLNPSIAVITALDPDHLDIYGTPEEMRRCYAQFATQVRTDGSLFYREGLPLDLSGAQHIETSTYGSEQGDYRAENIRVVDGHFVFDYRSPKANMDALLFTQAGRHNVENAAAAIAVALELGVAPEDIRKGLLNFKGIWRRFEFILRDSNKVFIDDYAHHPEEINAAISAARALYPNRKLTGVFQPHLYSRTRDFVDGFAAALDRLDECILLDIYPARELPIPGVTSAIIFDKMHNPNKQLILKKDLLDTIDPNNIEVLLTLGAGDIDKLVQPIKLRIEN